MLEISAVPTGLAAFGARQEARTSETTVPKLEGTFSGRTTSEYLNANPQKMPTEQEIHRARNLADDGLTGPPPAFQASLLEVQSDIQFVIKQVEAAREKANTQRAVAAESSHADAAEAAKVPATDIAATPTPYGADE